MALQGANDANTMARMAFKREDFRQFLLRERQLVSVCVAHVHLAGAPRLVRRLHVDMHSIGRELSSAARR